MSTLILTLILITSKATDAFPRDLKRPRFVLGNPGDSATYLGYVQHKVPDMTSLVDEVAHQNPDSFSQPEKPASYTGGDTANAHLPYNLPNFPAMLSSQGSSPLLGPGGSAPAGSGSSGGAAIGTSGLSANTGGGGGGSGNTPFGTGTGSGAISGGGTSGTGSIGAAVLNPLGIPSGPGFNMGSSTGGGGSAMTAGGLGSGSHALIGTSNGGVFQPFVCSSTSILNSCPVECIEVDAQNGCPICKSSCSSAAGGSSQLGSVTTNTAPTSCPPYPSNCPQIYSKMQNGCPICTILQQLHTMPPTTTTVPITHATCAPTQCLAPCNVGIIIKADGCPACKCPDHV